MLEFKNEWSPAIILFYVMGDYVYNKYKPYNLNGIACALFSLYYQKVNCKLYHSKLNWGVQFAIFNTLPDATHITANSMVYGGIKLKYNPLLKQFNFSDYFLTV